METEKADGTARAIELAQMAGSRQMSTKTIILRPWQESDAEALFKYASDPDVGSRAGWLPHKSVEESLDIIRTVFRSEGMWAVIWKESGEAIGCVGYLPASSSNLKIAEDHAEVGYWIGPSDGEVGVRGYWRGDYVSQSGSRLRPSCKSDEIRESNNQIE